MSQSSKNNAEDCEWSVWYDWLAQKSKHCLLCHRRMMWLCLLNVNLHEIEHTSSERCAFKCTSTEMHITYRSNHKKESTESWAIHLHTFSLEIMLRNLLTQLTSLVLVEALTSAECCSINDNMPLKLISPQSWYLSKKPHSSKWLVMLHFVCEIIVISKQWFRDCKCIVPIYYTVVAANKSTEIWFQFTNAGFIQM